MLRHAGPKRSLPRERAIIDRAVTETERLIKKGEPLAATRVLVHSLYELHRGATGKEPSGSADVPVEIRYSAIEVLRAHDLPADLITMCELLLDVRNARTGSLRNKRAGRDPRWPKYARLYAELLARSKKPNPNALSVLGDERGFGRISPHTLKDWLGKKQFMELVAAEISRPRRVDGTKLLAAIKKKLNKADAQK